MTTREQVQGDFVATDKNGIEHRLTSAHAYTDGNPSICYFRCTCDPEGAFIAPGVWGPQPLIDEHARQQGEKVSA